MSVHNLGSSQNQPVLLACLPTHSHCFHPRVVPSPTWAVRPATRGWWAASGREEAWEVLRRGRAMRCPAASSLPPAPLHRRRWTVGKATSCTIEHTIHTSVIPRVQCHPLHAHPPSTCPSILHPSTLFSYLCTLHLHTPTHLHRQLDQLKGWLAVTSAPGKQHSARMVKQVWG